MFWILLILLAVFAVLFILLPTGLNRQAVLEVITALRQYQAFDAESARIPEDIGLQPPGIKTPFFSIRRFHPRAVNSLIKGKMVNVTPEGRIYLVEAKLVNLNPYRSR